MLPESRGPVELPEPDAYGDYQFPDGSKVFTSTVPGYWVATWADGAILTGDNDAIYYFSTPEIAATALAEGGEGPAVVLQDKATSPQGKAARIVEAILADLQGRCGFSVLDEIDDVSRDEMVATLEEKVRTILTDGALEHADG